MLHFREWVGVAPSVACGRLHHSCYSFRRENHARIVVFGGTSYGGRCNRVSAFTGRIPLQCGGLRDEESKITCLLEEVPTGLFEDVAEASLARDLDTAVGVSHISANVEMGETCVIHP